MLILKFAWVFSLLQCHSKVTADRETNTRLDSIERQLSSQQQLNKKLEQQLNQLTDKFKALPTPSLHLNSQQSFPSNLQLVNDHDRCTDVGSTSAGVVYTRWGRKQCSGDAKLIYEGFAASSNYKYGGGVNYQCLPLDPQYSKYYRGGDHTYIDGTEYQVDSDHSEIFPKDTEQQNVPCARCFAPRNAHMMLPAKTGCPDGWTREYTGYLMTQRHTQTGSTYECVDENPEYVDGMESDRNGARFYFVKANCYGEGTTGHCPPYSFTKQLTCSVCTK